MAELDALLGEVRSTGRCGLRVLGDSLSAMKARLVGVAISIEPGHGRYIPLMHHALGSETALNAKTALERLAPMLSDPAILKTGHDLKPDCLDLGTARRGACRP